MRARHRHFNPRDIGARLVLDARYINQSDNAAVSTWSDRSGNGWSAEQATPANQPTFQTAEFGEAGAVAFDGSTDNLEVSGAVGALNNVAGATLFAVVKYEHASASANFGAVFFSRNGNSDQARAYIGLTNTSPTGYGAGGRRLDADSFQATASNTYVQNNNVIQSGVFDYANSDLFLFINGSQAASNTSFQTAGNTSATDSNVVRIGLVAPSFGQYLDGNIGQAAVFSSALTAAQRKRVEHSAARSFKLSCN